MRMENHKMVGKWWKIHDGKMVETHWKNVELHGEILENELGSKIVGNHGKMVEHRWKSVRQAKTHALMFWMDRLMGIDLQNILRLSIIVETTFGKTNVWIGQPCLGT